MAITTYLKAGLRMTYASICASLVQTSKPVVFFQNKQTKTSQPTAARNSSKDGFFCFSGPMRVCMRSWGRDGMEVTDLHQIKTAASAVLVIENVPMFVRALW